VNTITTNRISNRTIDRTGMANESATKAWVWFWLGLILWPFWIACLCRSVQALREIAVPGERGKGKAMFCLLVSGLYWGGLTQFFIWGIVFSIIVRIFGN